MIALGILALKVLRGLIVILDLVLTFSKQERMGGGGWK